MVLMVYNQEWHDFLSDYYQWEGYWKNVPVVPLMPVEYPKEILFRVFLYMLDPPDLNGFKQPVSPKILEGS